MSKKPAPAKKYLTVRKLSPGKYAVSVDIPDFLGLLSVITGLFAAYRVSIHSGEAKTLRAKAVDTFRVAAPEGMDWKKFEQELSCFAADYSEASNKELRRRVIEAVRSRGEEASDKLYPVDLRIDQTLSARETVIDIKGQDTPAFLFALTNSLSLIGINIARMQIGTSDGKVHDRLWLTDAAGNKIKSEQQLRALQWAVLLIKQFTHLLPKVPDPEAALREIVLFGKDVFERKDFDDVFLTLKQSKALDDLSRVFGTSQYLWEEFIRLQHASIYQIIGNHRLLSNRKSKELMRAEIGRALAAVKDYAEKTEKLNEYKDRELFRIDLRHLLGKTSYLEEFAEEFSDLVEVVVEAGTELAWQKTAETRQKPYTAAGKKSELSVLALGKLGGRELGYASDVELMFVYTDAPDRDKERSAQNMKFYCELVGHFTDLIQARSEGVFEIDLRMRPYGKHGPLAVPLDMFQKYYSKKGEAWEFERQALIRLRPVCGSKRLGKAITEYSDRYVYSQEPFDFQEAEELRQRQREELVSPGIWNAKFSAGGLLDAEYYAQTLQIIHGAKIAEIRTPNILQALKALKRKECLDDHTFSALTECYIFLRDLINALRIVRGNAKDLHVPEESSPEFVVLGRRLSYSGEDAQVRMDFGKQLRYYIQTAAELYERGMRQLRERSAAPALPRARAAADEKRILDWEELAQKKISAAARNTLASLGFLEADKAAQCFSRMGPERGSPLTGAWKKLFAGSAGLWREVPDPDMAAAYLERFFKAGKTPEKTQASLLQKPERLQWLLKLFGSSRYLSEILIRYPAYWMEMNDAQSLHPEHTLAWLEKTDFSRKTPADLRLLRHRETLRLGWGDLLRDIPVQTTLGAFSRLADVLLSRLLQEFFPGERKIALLALGKLGGEELNFSSDIDLMWLLEEDHQIKNPIRRIQDFLVFLEEGARDEFFYRVDLRLRPHGNSGSLFFSSRDYRHYYKKEAEPWEYQALIKARTAAGNQELGNKLLRGLEPVIYRKSWKAAEIEFIRGVKRQYEEKTKEEGVFDTHIKLGWGGIRDAEFTVQMLQLLRGYEIPGLRCRGTMEALGALGKNKLLKPGEISLLQEGYIFLRKVENRLHLYENLQVFNLPGEPLERSRLAKSMGFYGDARKTALEQFDQHLLALRGNIRKLFEKVFFSTKNKQES